MYRVKLAGSLPLYAEVEDVDSAAPSVTALLEELTQRFESLENSVLLGAKDGSVPFVRAFVDGHAVPTDRFSQPLPADLKCLTLLVPLAGG